MSNGFRVRNKFSKVLPSDMRALPEALYTTECGDETRIHANDPPHIRKQLLKDAAKRAVMQMPDVDKAKLLLNAWWLGICRSERVKKLDQELIDVVRGCVLVGRARKKKRVNFDVDHIWFSKPSGVAFSLKKGPQPRNGDRPAYLQDFDLGLDVLDWPERIRDTLVSGGISFDRIMQEVRSAKERQTFHEAVERAAGGRLGRAAEAVRESRIVGPDGEPVVS